MRSSRRLLAVAMVGALGATAALAPRAVAADTQVTLAATADTYVSSSEQTTNHGASTSMGVYGTPSVTSLLRFVVPAAPAGQVLSGARLRLTTTNISSAGSVNATQVRTAANTWTEATTYRNRPTVGSTVLGTLPGGSVANRAYWVTLDAAAVAAMNGSTTLALQGTGTDSLWLSTRNAPTASIRPALELTYTDAAPADTSAPTAPGDLQAGVADSVVSLAWSASQDDRGVTAYAVHRSDSSGFTPSDATRIGTTPGTSFSDPARPAGTWHYAVVALDAAGNASPPATTSATISPPPPPPPPPPPGPPTSVTTLANTADTYTSASERTKSFGIQTSLGIYGTPDLTALMRFELPATPAGRTLVGARLRVSTTDLASAGSANATRVLPAGDSWNASTTYNNRPAVGSTVLGTLPGGSMPSSTQWIPLDAGQVGALSGTTTTFALQGTGNDSLWLWSRRAGQNRPALELSYADSGPPDTTPPGAPGDLQSGVSGNAVTLTWTAAEDDRAVTRYTVHRSSAADVTPTDSNRIGVLSGTTYTDTLRPPGGWHYAVVAEDASGNKSVAATTEATVVDELPSSITVAAAGDLVCPPGTVVTVSTCKHQEVRDLLDSTGAQRFLAVGDLAQGQGTYQEFTAPGRFADTFGNLGSKLLPVVGNHELYTPEAQGYWDYFYGPGVTSGPYGDRPAGYYSTMVGGWRFISLNSECNVVAGGCGPSSPQYQWLDSLLQNDSTRCTVVAFHRPRWTTGSGHPPYTEMAPMWDLMANRGVDVALSAHNHLAEIFKPIGASGTSAQPQLDPQGIRPFTVGIGGASQAGFNPAGQGQFSALEARARATFGVLKLVLNPDGYDWQLLPVAGSTFTHAGTTGSFSGSDSCH